VRRTVQILLATALALGTAGPAQAQQPDASPPRKVKSHAKPKPAAKTGEALPCPRAKYPGDPVCFGVNDPAALPLPSAGSGAAAPRRAEDPTITAHTKLNETNRDPILGNNPNPHPSGNDFGGGVGLGVHF